MARIETYQRDNFISDSDIVIGSDGDNLNITKNYTIGQLKTYFTEGFVNIGGSGGSGVDTNFYLNGISTDENYLVTFSVVGATDQTLQLGSAAFSETTDFVSTAHTHVVADITDAGALASVNIINNTYIDKSNAGTSGQVLSLGTGAQFTWVDAVGSDTVGADELNISGTPSDGDVITYNSGNLLWATRNFLALSDTPAAFGATGALLKVNATADGLEFFTPSFAATSHTHTLSEITDSGDLAALDLITTSELDTVNTGSNTQVLALNNNLDLQWVTLTAASGIALTDLSVTQNSSGTAALSYNNSTGVFSYTPPDLSGYALTSHTHLLSDITDSGALAALDTITPSEITVTGTPTTAKVLGWSDANSFAWVDQTGGSGGTTYTQGDGIVITAANVIQLADDITVDNITVNENVTVTGDTTIGGDTIIGGDLTVNGITTTVNVNDLVINDRFIEINSGQTTTNVNDSGIIIERGSLTNAVLLWDESLDRFIVGTGNITAATTDANVSYSYSDMQASTFHGALAGNAATSSKWATARTLSFTGDVTASLPVQGHANASATATIGNDKVTKSKLKGLSNEAAESGKVVVSDGNDGFNLVAQSTITSADKAFTDLTDTPGNYTNASNNFVKVNPQGDALEYLPKVAESHLDIVNDPENGYVLEWDDTNNKMQWVPQAGGGVSNFTALTDTPNDYTNHDGKVAFVDESNNRLVFRHITFNDIYDSSENNPISYPPNDGQTYVLTGTTTGGVDDYEWVLDSDIIESGGGTVVTLEDPTTNYNGDGCANKNYYEIEEVGANESSVNNLKHDTLATITYYNGYLYAFDDYSNRYKSTTRIEESNNYDLGDLSQSTSWELIGPLMADRRRVLPTGLMVTPSSYASQDTFAFVIADTGYQTNYSEGTIAYITVQDFEDPNFAASANDVTWSSLDTMSGMSGKPNRNKLVSFGGYLWIIGGTNASYKKQQSSNQWTNMSFKTYSQGGIVQNTAELAKYTFSHSIAKSADTLLIGTFSSVQRIKRNAAGTDWVLDNISHKISSDLTTTSSNYPTSILVGLDYSASGDGTWYAAVGDKASFSLTFSYEDVEIYSYSDSSQENTSKMTNLVAFQNIFTINRTSVSSIYSFVGSAERPFNQNYPKGNPGQIIVRDGYLYFIAVTGLVQYYSVDALVQHVHQYELNGTNYPHTQIYVGQFTQIKDNALTNAIRDRECSLVVSFGGQFTDSDSVYYGSFDYLKVAQSIIIDIPQKYQTTTATNLPMWRNTDNANARQIVITCPN
jgi:hypothetical protein